ncbi:MAG: ATP synthase F1 subunit epsilon [Bacteroidales bacterium]|nr:ATP synthase F1 subunit epsilon [Bacteroidales bacterium]
MIKVRIISPEAELFSGEAQAVFLPGTLGEFEVLPDHAPIISSLDAGQVRLRLAAGKTETFKISSGFVRTGRGEMTVCVEL